MATGAGAQRPRVSHTREEETIRTAMRLIEPCAIPIRSGTGWHGSRTHRSQFCTACH